MRKELLAQWREDIVGEWQAELAGVDLLYLEPVGTRFAFRLVLQEDGTADWDFTIPNASPMAPQPTPPFPTRWELSDDRILSIWLPIAPMPDYDMPDWSRQQISYDVLMVADLSLTLSNRRFDGEDVIVLRRVNYEEYNRRKAAEYGQLIRMVKEDSAEQPDRAEDGAP
jgi:hypothetical protein